MNNNKNSLYPERVLSEILKSREIELPRTRHKIVIGDSRHMDEVANESVHLIVTSPPYPMIDIWDGLFKKLGCKTFNDMHDYLADVWAECKRVLVNGGIACINIGDALRKVNGVFRLFPNHAEVIKRFEELGFVTLPNILWKKPTTKPNSFLGSGFLPTNAYVTLDCEYILIFRKGGDLRKFLTKDPYRYASYYTKEERDVWFSQIWDIKGVKQESNEVERRVAAYPDEIPYRLLRMFSIIGDTVLDPFLGTGTTTKVAMNLHRNSIGYEIDEKMLTLIKKKIGYQQRLFEPHKFEIEIIKKH
ncbi:MAG: site-specific DNA-methyltransferase [Candidatus Bathyarchaeia archaeon]